MKNMLYGALAYTLFTILIVSCKKEEGNTPTCDTPPTVAINATNTACGTTNGALEVVASGGKTPFQFSLDGKTFQPAATFSNVGPGKYTVTVKDANGCTETKEATVVSGISYAASVHEIISTNCATGSCHVSGGNAPGDFSQFAQVKAKASRIKETTKSGTMPKGGTLTAEQIQQIACWVDDGALDN